MKSFGVIDLQDSTQLQFKVPVKPHYSWHRVWDGREQLPELSWMGSEECEGSMSEVKTQTCPKSGDICLPLLMIFCVVGKEEKEINHPPETPTLLSKAHREQRAVEGMLPTGVTAMAS